jgi:hypothetical protein
LSIAEALAGGGDGIRHGDTGPEPLQIRGQLPSQQGFIFDNQNAYRFQVSCFHANGGSSTAGNLGAQRSSCEV